MKQTSNQSLRSGTRYACSQCSEAFDVTKEDIALLDKTSPVIGGKKYDIPAPSMCFPCRLQRRLAFYNCRSLYKNTCASTNKPTVSIYSPDKPFTVYSKEMWWSDDWDPMEYGKDFDFNRPFFEQFRELMETVPLIALNVLGDSVNSDYTNDNYKLKNCYMVFDGERGEDCYHGHSFAGAKSCMDFIFLTTCELCYECVYCTDCYGLKYSQHCKNCWDSWFLRDCIGCKHCFGCANLRQKQYCIFNEQKTKEEYKEFLQQFKSSSYSAVQKMNAKAEGLFKTQPVRATRGEQNIDSVGDSIDNSKNAYMCFDCANMQDSRYCTNCIMGCKDCMDVHIWGDGMELCYNCCVCGANTRNLLSDYYVIQGCSDVYYSFFCSRSSSNLLGCIALRHKKHCIFNKQYSKDEYEDLAKRIVEHMKEAGEWGEFFPPTISAFGYNETMAQVWYPLTKDQVEEKGWQWSDYESPVEADKTIQANQLPDDSNDVPDDVLNWAIVCEVTGKPFKIVKQELQFYRDHKLPLPRRHPNQRHVDRFSHKNPYSLWERECAKTGEKILSNYAPDRPEIVYSEEAYKADIY